ncbi:MAG TPA: SGNH/GDSL hydrolase family protein [Micromonosporaceae bacterium]
MTDQAPAGTPGTRTGGRGLNPAALAAYAGGALTALGALGVGVLFGQAVMARLTIPGAEAPPPRCDGEYGQTYPAGHPIRLAVIGDSTAAGYGVHTAAQTPGALLATWIADAARRRVQLTCPAVVGSISAWLLWQVEIAIEAGVDLAVIFVGANDVTTRENEAAAVQYLEDAVRALRTAGAEVVVATCPDLGTIRPIRPPLRWLARHWSRRFAAAQAIAVARAGGRAVALGSLLGPEFEAAPERMFGEDRYHPSAEGYRTAAGVVLPEALVAIGLDPATVTPAEPGPAEVGEPPALERPGEEAPMIGPIAGATNRPVAAPAAEHHVPS